MADNRRENFRAPIADSISAIMFVGYRQTAVRLVEESSGGLSIMTNETLTYPLETDAELRIEDGRSLRVRIKHYERRGMSFHVGLQRNETTSDGGIDLRSEFSVPTQASNSKLYVGVLLLGFLIGWAVQTETVQRRLIQTPFIKAVLNGNPSSSTQASPSSRPVRDN